MPQFASVIWVLIALFAAAPFGQCLTGNPWGGILSAGTTMLVLSYLLDWALAWRFRERVQHFVREHESELQTVA
jgi:hypothetical protein